MIAKMLETHSKRSEFSTRCSDYYVQDMKDGGMGSIRFSAPSEAAGGSER